MKTYGLLGKNIGYSLSPVMHNAAFRALRLAAKYELFDTKEGMLDSFFNRLRKGDISGCNVTIPYKEKAMEFVDECDNIAGSIGALNTIALRDGSLVAHNTDCLGFTQALRGKNDGDLDLDPKGKNVFIFGAGGAAKAIIEALVLLNVKKIAITDVDRKKAENLADFAGKKRQNGSLITIVEDRTQYEEFISKADLLINATPCGMKESDAPLFDYRYIHENLYVFDLVYAVETPLINRSKTASRKSINGLNMLIYQAARSFTLWTGKEAPLDVMRKALLKKMEG